MIDLFSAGTSTWLTILLGVILFFNGLEKIHPPVARARLKKQLEQPDRHFQFFGVAFCAVGLAIVLIGAF
jgi:uncharacterized protein YjeT (DUF2065 family)